MNLVSKLLSKNISASQLIGFVLSNLAGLAIVITGVQLYADVRSLWESEDSFIRQDYIVVNKKVTAGNTLGQEAADFTEQDIADLERQPWVRRVGRFSSMDYRVSASVGTGDGRAMSTDMFFESIPDDFIDVDPAEWRYTPGSREIPVIISRDYLTLYNFGFASSAGMPQLTEQMIGSIPMQLRMRSESDGRQLEGQGRIVGFSNRINTILVPEAFMKQANAALGGGKQLQPRRLIVEVSSPGDVAIDRYMAEHGLELAGDKRNSQASYLLNVASGVIIGIGAVITLLSLFILLLSISLLMQKNRDKLHSLIMLGYPLKEVGNPYVGLVAGVSALSWVLAVGVMLLLRGFYAGRIAGLEGAELSSVWGACGIGLGIAFLTAIINIISVRRKVAKAF